MGRKRIRVAALAATAGLVSCAGLWIGIHEIPWLGPWLADTARAIVGPSAVARVEDFAYGVEDRYRRMVHGDDEPEALWEVPEPVATHAPLPPVPASSAGPAEIPAPAYPPSDVGPVHDDFAAKGDGIWVSMPMDRWPKEAPRLHKTLLHPDRKRPWTAVAVVAIDLPRVDVHLMAGKYVPEATEPEGRTVDRPAIIPQRDQREIIAAFNGGFKTIHGRLGMHVDGVTLIAPQPRACTVGKDTAGRLRIGTWEGTFESRNDLVWWRQAPTCLVEAHAFGSGVLSDDNANWGTSVHGSTFIRRSAVGIEEDGKVLFVGIGDAISARGLAIAMKHAGAKNVAQLDVNWTLPKFLTYHPREPGSDHLEPTPLYEGLQHVRDEYVRKASPRDFFYVTRRPRVVGPSSALEEVP